ncbi:MAG: carboxypeptidase regulatory-like domain-containing protein [Bacteroidia bacterium]
MRKLFLIVAPALLFNTFSFSQNWSLELKSYVEFRTWSLTTKDVSKETQLKGATIKLFQNGNLVSQVTSDADGEFTLIVPPNGEYTGEVSYPGCNTKRFSVSTNGVPPNIGTDDYKATHTVKGGFVMVKPYPGIDYTNLNQSLIKIAYLPSLKNFDDVPEATEAGLALVKQVYDQEDILFKKFCAKNREGDAALKIPDCPLARKLYNEAIAIIPNEEYPVEQLKKVGACLEEMEVKAKAKEKAKLEAEEKEKQKAAEKEKSAADKLAKENEEKEKAKAKELADKEKTKAKVNEPPPPVKKKPDEDEAAKKKKKAEDEELEKKKKKADDDEIARKKRKAEEDEAARKKKGSSDNDLIKAKPIPNEGDWSGGKKSADRDDGEVDATGSKHRPVRNMMAPDQYKADMAKANDLFKHKRYEEAKPVYQQALESKPKDPAATAKLAEIEKLLKK